MEETKKDILHAIYNLNKTETLFYTKMKFINLSHLIQILDDVSEDQLKNIKEKILLVEEEFAKSRKIVDDLYIPSLELIKSYDRTNYISEQLDS